MTINVCNFLERIIADYFNRKSGKLNGENNPNVVSYNLFQFKFLERRIVDYFERKSGKIILRN